MIIKNNIYNRYIHIKYINISYLKLCYMSFNDYIFDYKLPFYKSYKYAIFSYINALNGLGHFNNYYLEFLGAPKPHYLICEECERLICNRRAKNSRIKKKIIKMLQSGQCLFLTLTFTDSILNNTSSQTRRRYVQRFHEKYNCLYLANIDFGQNDLFTKREHYHSIICTDSVSHLDWHNGAIHFERVRQTSSATALSKYINKFTNHATKKGVSTRLIASKKFFE